MHESQMNSRSSFITLTYAPENYHPSLNYHDFQLFILRVRRTLGPTRFFAVGEYGDENLRPHWHAILFGHEFKQDYPVTNNVHGSHQLDELWGKGHASHGPVTFESAGYCARYAVKKVTGPKAEQYYTRLDHTTGELVRVQPEIARMSLKPGIGYTWFQKYWREIYEARDGIVRPGGHTIPPPRYYDKLLQETDHELKDQKDLERYIRSQAFADDTTPERLAVREKCAAAKAAFLKRQL